MLVGVRVELKKQIVVVPPQLMLWLKAMMRILLLNWELPKLLGEEVLNEEPTVLVGSSHSLQHTTQLMSTREGALGHRGALYLAARSLLEDLDVENQGCCTFEACKDLDEVVEALNASLVEVDRDTAVRVQSMLLTASAVPGHERCHWLD